jgi:hypothetical protein
MQLTYRRVATVAWLTYPLVDISFQISDFSIYYETHTPHFITSILALIAL